MGLIRRPTPAAYEQSIGRNRSVPSAEGNINFVNRDLSNGDLVIPDDIDGLDGNMNFGGSDYIAFAIESQDDEDFEVKLQWVPAKDDDTVVFEWNEDKEPQMATTDPVNGNIYAANDISVEGDYFRLVVSTKAGATQNRVKGTINGH